MKCISYVFILIAFAAAPVVADTPDVDRCTHIEDKMRRLSCYDSLFLQTEPPGEKTTAGDENEPQAGQEVDSPKAAPATTPDLGSEQLEKAAVEKLEARLVGDFTGWSGNTVFRLDNGQVWQQRKNYITNYRPRDPIPAPRVTITKGWFGGYDLRVEGVKRSVQVKRIE